MRRIEWLPSLISHFKNDPILSEVSKHSVIAKADYKGFDEDAQKTPAIWIIPLEATPIKQPGPFADCLMAKQKVLICAVVRNSKNTIDNFSINKTTGLVEGSYPNASRLEDKVIDSISKWNRNNADSGNLITGYINQFVMTEILAVDAHNGSVIMPTVWETKIRLN